MAKNGAPLKTQAIGHTIGGARSKTWSSDGVGTRGGVVLNRSALGVNETPWEELEFRRHRRLVAGLLHDLRSGKVPRHAAGHEHRTLSNLMAACNDGMLPVHYGNDVSVDNDTWSFWNA